MSFFSILRLSFHSLWGNKLRTLLTIIVIAVVSFVVVLLAGVGYSFYASVNQNVGEVFRTVPSVVDVNAVKTREEGSNRYVYSGVFSVEQAETILEVLDNDDGYFTSVSFFNAANQYVPYSARFYGAPNGNSSVQFIGLPYYAGSNPFIGLKNDGSTFIQKDAANYLESGRMWNTKDDEKSLNVWLSADAMRNYALGDSITVYSYKYDYMGQPYDIKSFTGSVAGFLNVWNSWGTYIFIDYHHFNETRGTQTDNEWYYTDSMTLNHIYATMVPQPGYTYGVTVQNYLKDILKKADAAITPDDGAEMQSRCNTLEELQYTMIMVWVVIGLALFVSLIIVLLSIGSVANTIKISAEQNRKFFGMMKAIGMKNRSLRQILTGQIIIMTVLGVLIATLGAYLAIGAASMILSTLLGSLFYMLDEIILICTISPFIPIIVVAALTGIVLLFTRSNMHAISKMDVITVINEVN